jgi:hypothetical protein
MLDRAKVETDNFEITAYVLAPDYIQFWLRRFQEHRWWHKSRRLRFQDVRLTVPECKALIATLQKTLELHSDQWEKPH